MSVTNTCLEDQFWSHFSVPVKSRISRSPYGLRSYVYRFLDQYHEVPLEYVVIVSYPDPWRLNGSTHTFGSYLTNHYSQLPDPDTSTSVNYVYPVPRELPVLHPEDSGKGTSLYFRLSFVPSRPLLLPKPVSLTVWKLVLYLSPLSWTTIWASVDWRTCSIKNRRLVNPTVGGCTGVKSRSRRLHDLFWLVW